MVETSQMLVSKYFAEAQRRQPLTNGPFQHFSITSLH